MRVNRVLVSCLTDLSFVRVKSLSARAVNFDEKNVILSMFDRTGVGQTQFCELCSYIVKEKSPYVVTLCSQGILSVFSKESCIATYAKKISLVVTFNFRFKAQFKPLFCSCSYIRCSMKPKNYQ